MFRVKVKSVLILFEVGRVVVVVFSCEYIQQSVSPDNKEKYEHEHEFECPSRPCRI